MSTDTKTGIINTPTNTAKGKSSEVDNQPKGNSVEISNGYDYGKVKGGSLAVLYECFNAIIENMKYVMEISADLAVEQSKMQSQVTEVNVKAEIHAGEHQAAATRNSAIGDMVGGGVGLAATGAGMGYSTYTSKTQLAPAEAKVDALKAVQDQTHVESGKRALDQATLGEAARPAAMDPAVVRAAKGDFDELIMKPADNGKSVRRPDAEIKDKLALANKDQLDAIQDKLAKRMDVEQAEVNKIQAKNNRATDLARSGTQISGEFSRGTGQILAADEQLDQAEQNALKTGAAAAQQIGEASKEKFVSQVNEAYNQILQQLAALKAAGQEAARGG